MSRWCLLLSVFMAPSIFAQSVINPDFGSTGSGGVVTSGFQATLPAQKQSVKKPAQKKVAPTSPSLSLSQPSAPTQLQTNVNSQLPRVANSKAPRANRLIQMIDNTNFSPWLAFSQKVIRCTPMNYTLPSPGVNYVAVQLNTEAANGQDISEAQYQALLNKVKHMTLNFQVLGMAGDQCNAKITGATSPQGNKTMQCNFSNKGLLELSEFARDLAKGSQAIDPNIPNPIEQYCHYVS